MDRQLPSSIRTDTAKRHFYQVWSIIGIVLIIAAAGYVSGVLSTPIAIVVWAAIFVLILRKPVAFFEAHGIPRVLGTALSYLLFALVLGLLGIVMFSPAFGLGAVVCAGSDPHVERFLGPLRRHHAEHARV